MPIATLLPQASSWSGLRRLLSALEVRGTLVQNADGKAVLNIGEVQFDLVLAPDGRLLSAAIPSQGLTVERIQ